MVWIPICSSLEGTGPRPSAIAAAKTVCGRCRVQGPCLAYALATRQPYGIFGGLSEDDRRGLMAPPASPMMNVGVERQSLQRQDRLRRARSSLA